MVSSITIRGHEFGIIFSYRSGIIDAGSPRASSRLRLSKARDQTTVEMDLAGWIEWLE